MKEIVSTISGSIRLKVLTYTDVILMLQSDQGILFKVSDPRAPRRSPIEQASGESPRTSGSRFVEFKLLPDSWL